MFFTVVAALASDAASKTGAISVNRPKKFIRTGHSAIRIMFDEYTNPDGKTNISVQNYRDIGLT
jgi:hypothetical protein